MKQKLLFLLLLLAASPAMAQPLLLDSTFATNGYTQNTGSGTATDMVVAANGKIIMSLDKRPLQSQTDLSYVCRYQSNGRLDSTFGVNGLASVWSAGDDVVANSVSVQPDDKVVFTGHGDYCNLIVCGMNNIIVGRFTALGVIDSSFGTNGQVHCGDLFGPYIMESLGQHVFVLPSGKILVSGRILDQQAGSSIFVARLNSDGTPDQTFGSSGDGVVRLGVYADVKDMLVESSGAVYVTGAKYIQNDTNNLSDGYIFKLTPSGLLDNTFGISGRVLVNAAKFDYPQALALRQDGKLVIGGFIERVQPNFNPPIDTAIIYMLNTNGTYSSVIPGGYRLIPMAKPSARIFDIGVENGNAIFITGTQDTAYRTDAFVARLNPDASFDYSFSGTGQSVVYYTLGVYTTYQCGTMLYSMKRISTGQILVSGGRNPVQTVQQSVLLMRLNAPDNITTATAPIAEPTALSAYPNPFHDVIWLSNPATETGLYSIYDATGKLIQQAQLTPGTVKIDLSAYPSGVYFLISKTESEQRTFKLVRE